MHLYQYIHALYFKRKQTMFGVFAIICLLCYLFIEIKTYFILRDDSVEPVTLGSESRIYELCQRVNKLNTMSIAVLIIGYIVCLFPLLFIKGVESGEYIIGVAGLSVLPAVLVYTCYRNIKNSHGRIEINSEELKWNRSKSFSIKVGDIKKVVYLGLNCYQIHLKYKTKKPFNINLYGFCKKKEIHSLMKQLRDYVARTMGQDRCLTYKVKCVHWAFERFGYAYVFFVRLLLFAALLYTSYCCIDYEFFGKDYTLLYNNLDADLTQTENAWTYYVQAAQSYVDLDEDLQKLLRNENSVEKQDLAEQQIEQIKNWFSDNSLAWANLKQAASIKYCNAAYDDISFNNDSNNHDFSSPGDSGYGQIKHLYSNLSYASHAGIIDVYWLELFKLQLASAEHFANGKSLIDQLVGYAFLGNCVGILADQDDYCQDDLMGARVLLKEHFPNGMPLLNTEGEVLITCSTINSMYNFKRIPKQTPLNPAFLMVGSNSGTDKHVRCLYADALEKAQQGIEVESEGFSVLSFPLMRNALLNVVEPAIGMPYKVSQRTNTTLSAAFIVINLEEYYLMKGCYPKDIQQLGDVGLRCKLPDDPDTDGCVIYSNDGKRAILYSVGKNGVDDKGYKDSKNSKGERDDIIFWKRKLSEMTNNKR